MKKIYAVSLVFTKADGKGGFNIVNSLVANVEAENKEEAFGIAYKNSIDGEAKEYQLFNHACLEQTSATILP